MMLFNVTVHQGLLSPGQVSPQGVMAGDFFFSQALSPYIKEEMEAGW